MTIQRRSGAIQGGDLNDHMHPVLARVYAGRNIQSRSEVDLSLDRLLPPSGLKGIDHATSLLADGIINRCRIAIVADFDADGATSCALAVRALKLMGATDVVYVVPNRFEYGYGLTPEIVAYAARLQPDILVTVDNGITSGDGVRAAQGLGMRVLITDHHPAGRELPTADAIVNPNQPGDTFASKNLAGVGVTFYVMLALRARLRDSGWFNASGLNVPNLAQFLDLVALGTIADVVPLDQNNRILVAHGLSRLNNGLGCPGIRALIEVSGRKAGRLSASDLGFAVAPRLNAAGRLTDMTLGIECLLDDKHAAAQEKARLLDNLNRERRAIEADMQSQATAALESMTLADGESSLPKVLCLFDESWHQGVVGILAARIKDRLHRPVIAFALAGDGELRGSARSIPGLHIRDALEACAVRHPTLLSKFGGHAMAAGLSLPRANLAHFSDAINDEIGLRLDDKALRGHVWTDGELLAEEITLDLAEQLRAGGPWGQGFPEPLFDGQFEILGARVVGEKHLKLNIRHPHGRPIEAIAFNQGEQLPSTGQLVEAAYRLDVNEYQDMRNLQLVFEHFTPV